MAHLSAPAAPPTPDAHPPAKSFVITWLLALVLGVIAADRFYLGLRASAAVKLVTLGGLGAWWLLDLVATLAGARRDRLGRPLAGYRRHCRVARILTGSLVVLGLLIHWFHPAATTGEPAALL